MRSPAPYLLTDLTGGMTPRGDKREGDTLSTLALRVSRLTPSHRDPEAFHEEKSEIVAGLRRLARQRGNGHEISGS
jgi:hypothetical protein